MSLWYQASRQGQKMNIEEMYPDGDTFRFPDLTFI